ncbi:extracellular solute-binding protein [Thioalkalivibrio sulfidiphilus]|uniref:extracellular solute-binding protein n=1 Tax=Thioalkalivibrio sulfidiphilus TaxID=1033854 RepID=UPI001E3E8B58|nr:extracellular solute-binding protein [Thioalkalivibrio sulfidiphilus]
MRTTRSTLLCLVFLLPVLSGCDTALRDENTLVVYSAGPRALIETVVDSFEAQTGARVELFAATTGQIMAKLEAEKYRPRADVVIFASQVAAEALKQDGRLLSYQPEWLDLTHSHWHDPDHYYLATGAALVGVAMRAEAADLSLDWKDFLDGGFPGRVLMPMPSRSGAAGDFLVSYALSHEESIWDDFLAARQQGLQFAAANSQAISSLLIGSVQAIMGAVDYLIYRQIEGGEPLVMHYPPSGSALVLRPIVILADTPVPDLARRFVDTYFSVPMQQAVADAHLLPAHREVAWSPVRSHDGLPPLLPLDMQQALKRQTEILRRFQYQVERAQVVRAGQGQTN